MNVMNTLYILPLMLSVHNSLALATFGTAPFIYNSTKFSLLSGNKEHWQSDNWLVTGGSNSSSGCVADKQLTIIDNQRTFDPETTSFSLRPPVTGEIYLVDQNGRQNVSFKEDSNKWCNFSVIVANDNVSVFVNNQLRKNSRIDLLEINVQLKNNTVWKVHCNQFMMSEKVTDGKPATVALKSTHTENSCFLLYVSLCEKCVLTIPELNRTYHSTRNKSFLHSWEVYQLEIESGIEHLSFYKTRTDNSMFGYWGIDLHECLTSDIEVDTSTATVVVVVVEIILLVIFGMILIGAIVMLFRKYKRNITNQSIDSHVVSYGSI
ncbi:unnamed protein product [Tenebrio molitor]|nr:unnamed protein product [Tenebrio molitor]